MNTQIVVLQLSFAVESGRVILVSHHGADTQQLDTIIHKAIASNEGDLMCVEDVNRHNFPLFLELSRA